MPSSTWVVWPRSPPLVEELKANHRRFFRHLAIVFPNFPHVLSPNSLPTHSSDRSTDIKITAQGQWAQPEWPEILQIHMLLGTRKALEDPSSALIDQSTAVALFGRKDPGNATIRVDNSIVVK